jgi:hypothetical protein
MSRHLAEVFGRAARGVTGTVPPGSPEPACRPGQCLSVTDLLRMHGDDSAAVLLMVLAMLCVTPIAGVGTLLGGVIIAIAWRWHQGTDASILPERLGRVTLSEAWTRRCLHALAWMYATADRRLKARWSLLSHRGTHDWWRLWIAVMALLIVLPLPLGNVLPALSLVLLSLGWMFRDGLMLLLSTAVGAGAIGFAFAMGHVLLAAFKASANWILTII